MTFVSKEGRTMKCCDAILDFLDGNFVICELEHNHKDTHQALMFQWEGEGTTKGHCSERLRGLQLLKMKFIMSKNGEKT